MKNQNCMMKFNEDKESNLCYVPNTVKGDFKCKTATNMTDNYFDTYCKKCNGSKCNR